MNPKANSEQYAAHLFNGEAGPPPDPSPPAKKRGRKPGSKNKPKPPPEESSQPQSRNAKLLTAPLTKAKQEEEVLAMDSATREAAAQGTKQRLGQLDFRAFGNRSRILVLILQDTSPSEQPHEGAWVEGSRAVAEELGKTPVARSVVDVAHGTGAEKFELLSVAHGANFTFPAGGLEYGAGTRAVPWLAGITAVVTTYREHLAGLGIDTREVVVIVCSDFCFGDDFWDALAAFKEWAAAGRVTVVPAVFGAANRGAAADFATTGVPVVDLKELKLGPFFKALSQSVVRVSTATPERGLMAKALNEAVTPKTD